VNDTYGHPAGDRVLAAVAHVFRSQQRPNDVAGRLGGEEFAVLLPGATAEAALAVAERIRAGVAATAVDWKGRTIGVTLSFGCAELEPATLPEAESGTAIERLVQHADAALYAAKEAGRNRSVVYSRSNEARARVAAD
jgi:diguanylate cyclase (GGDEF)-like protein